MEKWGNSEAKKLKCHNWTNSCKVLKGFHILRWHPKNPWFLNLPRLRPFYSTKFGRVLWEQPHPFSTNFSFFSILFPSFSKKKILKTNAFSPQKLRVLLNLCIQAFHGRRDPCKISTTDLFPKVFNKIVFQKGFPQNKERSSIYKSSRNIENSIQISHWKLHRLYPTLNSRNKNFFFSIFAIKIL